MVYDKSVSSRVLDLFVHGAMIVVFGLTLLPILHIVAVSFSDPAQVALRNVGIWPVQFQFGAYETIFLSTIIPRAFVNSLVITAAGTLINVVMTTITAYAISKKELPLRALCMVLIVITMFFGGGLIPNFLLVKALGMYNTYWALIVPGAISAYNLIILMTFFKNFPGELEDSARLDGCNEWQMLWRIVLPLSMAPIAVIGLFYAVSHWNSFFSALIYLKEQSKYPLQVILRDIVLESQLADELAQRGDIAAAEQFSRGERVSKFSSDSIKYATLVVSMVPMLIMYPFVQKHFVKGIMIGSLKG